MGKYILVVPSSAKAGQDDAYNRWYDGEHLADLCAIPGVVSGKRFEALPTSPDAPPGAYLAIYDIEADDPSSVLAELTRRAQEGEISVSEALDASSARLWLFRAR